MWPTNGYNQFNKSMNNDKRTILPNVLVRLSTLLMLDLLMLKLSVARETSVNFWSELAAQLCPTFGSAFLPTW